MISHLRGILDGKSMDSAIIDAGGVGYKVFIPLSTSEKLPSLGKEIKLFIVESVAMYGGSTSYYGFLTEEERDIFNLLKDEVPGAGAKKALEYLDKVTKSLPDFRRSIIQKDVSTLTGIFGFTKKTAEKIMTALKDKIGELKISGTEKWVERKRASTPQSEAVAGLVALGYKEMYAYSAVEKISDNGGAELSVEEIIRQALKYI